MVSVESSLSKRVVFTGGSGVAGRHVVSGLLDYGHQILNVDIAPLDDHRVHTIRADLSQSGQAFNSFSSHFKLTQPFIDPIRVPDAVIHFAGVPRNLLVTDDELFRINTQSAYNVIEAAAKMGVKKIILASSVTVYGVTFAEGHIDYPSFPVDESVDANPMDTYAMSKLCMERIARSFARRFGIDIYVLRLGAVITPDEYEEAFLKYSTDLDYCKAHGWSYTDVRDLAQMCKLSLEVDGLGFQIFNATNDEITLDTPTEEFLKKVCPETPFTRRMEDREAPLSNRKMKELLDFQEQHKWQNYVSFVDSHA
jgi:nucleoside-diphosphate-sugar epimerase